MKFLCDEMLGRLGRWLRAAGYDTEFPDKGSSDRANLNRARRENRYLVTRDRRLCDLKGSKETVVILDGNSAEDWGRQLGNRLQLDWVKAPFSRCLVCNTPLEEAPEKRRQELPKKARTCPGPLTRCPRCETLFWQGGHVARLKHTLEKLNRAKEAGKP